MAFDTYYVCAKPWQRMTIAYDGRVHQCISDYSGRKILGDASKESLQKIWKGEFSEAIRQAFKKHTYLESNPACHLCSYGVVTEPDKVNLKGEMRVRKYKGIEDVVIHNQISRHPPKKNKLGKKKGSKKMESSTNGLG